MPHNLNSLLYKVIRHAYVCFNIRFIIIMYSVNDLGVIKNMHSRHLKSRVCNTTYYAVFCALFYLYAYFICLYVPTAFFE